MTLTLDNNSAKNQIRGFTPGRIQVNDQTLTNSIIITPNTLITHWEPQSISELTRQHLTPIVEMHPAILLIGTGKVLQFPSIDIYGDLLNEGIGVEIMDTAAACRTYNVLTSEGRDVIAALIIN